MTDYQNWLLDIDQNIAILTLNRSDDMNSLTIDTFHELRDIAHRLRENRDVWAIIFAERW